MLQLLGADGNNCARPSVLDSTLGRNVAAATVSKPRRFTGFLARASSVHLLLSSFKVHPSAAIFSSYMIVRFI
jgi:hypothetical protein